MLRNSLRIWRLGHLVAHLPGTRPIQQLHLPAQFLPPIASRSAYYSTSAPAPASQNPQPPSTGKETDEETASNGTSETSGADGDPAVDLQLTDPAELRRLRILQLEVDVLRQEGRRVPAKMRPDHWQHVLELPSKSARTKYYNFLFTVERKRENEKQRRADRRELGAAAREERHQQLVADGERHIAYSLSGCTYFLRFYETTMNHWQNNKLIQAMRFGQPLVLDCSYDQHMTKRECIHAAKQLMFCFAENRDHAQPFDLHLCNADLAGHTMDYLRRHIPTLLEPSFPLNVHSGSYLEQFPRERLVYLTPHCNTDLSEYNADDVYIIGAMVDTMHNEPLSLAKAKQLGLRMARLPLDRHLQWGSGSGKSLTLNQMTHIMLDLKETGDWRRALSHVPRRKLADGGVPEAAEAASTATSNERRKWSQAADKMRMTGSGQQRRNVEVAEAMGAQSTSTATSSERVNKFRRKAKDD